MSASDPLRDRIRGEYLEMPGLHLTIEQMQRLCTIERAVCQMVLDALVDEKFLCVTSGGAYARATEGTIVRPRAARAALRFEQGVGKAS
jgi:hypothetical protein